MGANLLIQPVKSSNSNSLIYIRHAVCQECRRDPHSFSLQAIVIQDEALDQVLPKPLGSPDTELSAPDAVNPVAYGNDGIKIIMIYASCDLSRTF
jgi:hypothetical protein